MKIDSFTKSDDHYLLSRVSPNLSFLLRNRGCCASPRGGPNLLRHRVDTVVLISKERRKKTRKLLCIGHIRVTEEIPTFYRQHSCEYSESCGRLKVTIFSGREKAIEREKSSVRWRGLRPQDGVQSNRS